MMEEKTRKLGQAGSRVVKVSRERGMRKNREKFGKKKYCGKVGKEKRIERKE